MPSAGGGGWGGDSVCHNYQSYKPPAAALSIVVLSDAALPQIMSSVNINMIIVIITVSAASLFSAVVLSCLELTVVVCRVMWI